MNSSHKIQPVMPQVLKEISKLAHSNDGFFHYESERGTIPTYIRKDIIENGAIMLNSRTFMQNRYLEENDVGCKYTHFSLRKCTSKGFYSRSINWTRWCLVGMNLSVRTYAFT